jgi:cytochrome d ubiquinol oxidase subunit I
VVFNPVAQAKFVHTVSAGYVTGSVFVLAISALFLLQGRHAEIAKRSMVVAASFGLAAALSVVVLGDESGYLTTEHQKMKLAAMENMDVTEPAPASFTLFAIPTGNGQTFEIKIPWVLGLISTRSLDRQVPGIADLVQNAQARISNGLVAYTALEAIKANPEDAVARATFATTSKDFGYALLLKQFRPDIENATLDQIAKAAEYTVPDRWSLFWSFRLMTGVGFFFIAFFAYWFWQASRQRLHKRRWALWVAVCALPLPWLAIEAGWLIAEYGRQPWVVEGVLPTFYAASGLHVWDLAISLVFFVTLYTALAIVMVWLMVRAIKHGPAEKSVLTPDFDEPATAQPEPLPAE